MSTLHKIASTSSTAVQIVESICESLQDEHDQKRLGSFTATVYDTAWVSMVRDRRPLNDGWLFPASFDYVLGTQLEDGTWESYASPVDGILNTLAALLALMAHKSAAGEAEQHDNLEERIVRGTRGLASLLRSWSIEGTVHVGFEMLVPSLLTQVESYDGIDTFEFPGRQQLFSLYQRKREKFKPEMAYSDRSLTLLHSLEALVGLIDFDKVGHHCSQEVGIFGSPAATAAYLEQCSTWDDRAEAYLRMVVDQANCGEVPSAFPTVIFECSWAISTLLDTVIKPADLPLGIVKGLCTYFQGVIDRQRGVVGFAPGILEDADDTARVLLTLHRLGAHPDASVMIERFRTSSCFRTYELEGAPSFSANCNVLLALLTSEDLEKHKVLVEQILEYLLCQWESGGTGDKWHLSPYYSWMLLAEILVLVFRRRQNGHLMDVAASLTDLRIPVALCRLISGTIGSQAEDGSWNHTIEETAYCVLILAKCLTLPWDPAVRDEMLLAHARGANYLSDPRSESTTVDYLWVEKVSYSSTLLRRTYQLAALHAIVEEEAWDDAIRKLFRASTSYTDKMWPMLRRLPLFQGVELPCSGLALVEATRLTERLRETRNTIFPRDELPMTKDEYLVYIPMFWTLCNQLSNQALSSNCLWDMVWLSMLNYQVDEYMETVVQDLSASDVRDLVMHIEECCMIESVHGSHEPSNGNEMLGLSADKDTQQQAPEKPSLKRKYGTRVQHAVRGVMSAYINHILQHRMVVRRSSSDQRALASSLVEFLKAHVAQNINSQAYYRSLRQKTNGIDRDVRPSVVTEYGFLDWVRSSGAASTSCPLSFRFFSSLLHKDPFEGPRGRYLSQALAAHLATLCRMYNDCGSVARDASEENLNSINFAEYDKLTCTSDGDLQAAKDELLVLAQFERRCMELAFRELSETASEPKVMDAVRVFVSVTDLFGQMYVFKDIASRMKRTPNGKN